MTLRLHDTATRDVRDFVPLEEGKAGIYVCGLTVQSEPHVGHVRSAVNFDVLRRWLTASGYDVTFIRNVTDIDDKILAKSEAQGRPWFEIAYLMGRELDKALDAINVLPPTFEPAATGHVPEILELIAQLVTRGHAYPAEDGSGDVYFDVRSWPSYGELTRQKVDDMESAEDADPRGKRDPRDFALWKGWKKALEPETAAWPSPYGPGRPGWHIECSAMAAKYLGPAFDIHGGGVDLRFPHHENELAQSRAAGQQFASYWLHNAWITTAGEKMSKSLGNSLLIPSVLERVRGIELRFYMVSAHYRSHVEFSFEALDEAARSFRRIESFLERAGEATGHLVAETEPVVATVHPVVEGVATVHPVVEEVATAHPVVEEAATAHPVVEEAATAHPVVEEVALRPSRNHLPPAFVAAMDDDLGTPAAIAVIHDTVREGNRLLQEGESGRPLAELVAQVRSMLDVLGLNPSDPAYVTRGADDAKLTAAVDALVVGLLEERSAARAAQDWARADAIRDRIAAAGIAVEDTPDGPKWTLAEGDA
ncbi:MAG: cysteine--tRNA ligase [Nocardioides sp.]